MNVIRHKMVAQQSQFVKIGILSKQIEIHLALVIGSKNELAGIASLSYVMRSVNVYDTY
jgi:hypothetical protein